MLIRTDRNTEILAVAPNTPEQLEQMVERISKEDGRKPDFPFLSDIGHRVIDRYGLLNPGDPRGIPHPTTLVLDKRGVVRWKFVEVNHKVRPTNAQILAALDALGTR